jgi:hypothetical protein
MKDWQAAIRTWEQKENYNKGNPPKSDLQQAYERLGVVKSEVIDI